MAQGATGWAVLGVLVVGALALDLFVFNRRSHVIHLREALLGSAAWIGLALAFNLGVLYTRGPVAALEFLTGYLIELSLSVDNLFVFLLLFRYFAVPAQHQHRVLFWGILGAVVMRLAFILAGVALLERFHWIIYLFGAVLIFSGIKMASHQETEIHPERNPVLKLARRLLPLTPGYEGAAMVVRRGSQVLATPLLLVLIMVETTDLVFAVDSIPAVLAITRDPFIVFSSNIFAILGLRAMFFSLAGVMDLFHYLHYGLSAILVFVGAKMVLSDVFHVPTPIALGVVGGILVTCVVASILHRGPARTPPSGGPPAAGPEGD
jgi:tellurite resistance protein TerC